MYTPVPSYIVHEEVGFTAYQVDFPDYIVLQPGETIYYLTLLRHFNENAQPFSTDETFEAEDDSSMLEARIKHCG